MNVPLLDLRAQYAAIREEIEPEVLQVFAEQGFILGPRVLACEEAVAAYSQCTYACGVSSGTDALQLALRAEEIGPGDEVITSPYPFFATGGSIARVGAKPVFVDTCPHTWNLCPTHLEAVITERTRAIMPVHLYGQMAEMERIMDIAGKHNLVVIEDGAQAIGAEFADKRAGSFGDYGCFSFFPSKNLGGAGDGGMVVTNDEARAEKLARLRNHGSKPKYYHAIIGGNFRLDALQAAVVNVKLKHLDAWTEARQRNAVRYHRLFQEAGLAPDPIKLPEHPYADEPDAVGKDHRHIFNQYVITVSRRDELRGYLQEKGIGCEIYYPVPLHLQECFRDLGYKPGSLPESERAAEQTLALPIYPELSDDQAAQVVKTIEVFYRSA